MVTSKCYMDRFGTEWNQRRCGSTQIFTSLVSNSSVSNCHCYSICCRKVRLFFNLIVNSVMPGPLLGILDKSQILLDRTKTFLNWAKNYISLRNLVFWPTSKTFWTGPKKCWIGPNFGLVQILDWSKFWIGPNFGWNDIKIDILNRVKSEKVWQYPNFHIFGILFQRL